LIFADTSFLFAVLNHRDHHHPRCVEVLETLRGQRAVDLVVTTDHVVMETITLARNRVSHQAAVFAGERLYAEKLARIYETTLAEQREAFEYLKRHRDKHYSAVDCLSFVVMEKLGIREAFAVDADFAHRFIVRPGPA
jgi:uncharacterized protein